MHYAKQRKSSQTQKATNSMYPFIWHPGKGRGVRIEKQISGCQGLGVGEQLTVMGQQKGTWEAGTSLYFEHGDGYMT